MAHADLVADLPELPQGVGGLVELPSRFKADGVDNEMGVDMFRVTMGGDLDLMPRPRPGGKLQTYLVGLLISDLLLRGKGLNVLIEIDAIQLIPGSFGGEELREGVGAVTVQPGHIPPPILGIRGLVLPLAVADHGFHGAGMLLRFLDVGHSRQGFPPMRIRAS